MATDLWLVIGLGNPGTQYAGNRHNVGHMVVDEIASRMNSGFSSHKARAAIAQGRLGMLPGGVPGPRVIAATLNCYMNVSGGPTSGLAQYFDVPAERIVVVHDELDIPFATLKAKVGGGEGGHNGLKDISKALGTKDYPRIRVGVGRPPGRQDVADFVLKDFSATERKELPFLLDDAADAVELLITQGLTATQQKYHSKDS